ncbi:Protein LITTLE ZIPPER like [Quillaja saponaria]|uniref:Protein LITTLE ZIPPER like n=1 Tax=Quillaja saponaria TaxID=32244 RepID=A0AAD7PEZ4_QUISA|nr:Protein LITTLE ZIPPER like [Quillaja saponaria]
MCISNTGSSPFSLVHSSMRKQRSKQPKIRVYRLTRRRYDKTEGKDLELKNWKLYLENETIKEENAELRKEASRLLQENLALMTEFRKKFLNLSCFSATLNDLHKH